MNVLEIILTSIANNLFRQVAILLGLITLVGLLLQRKRIEEVIGGALRATIGVVILFIGVDVFVAGLSAFQTIVSSGANLEPPTAENTLATFLGSHGGTVALVITVAFAIHVALVRIFPAARYVYLTGHLMFWISVVATASLVEVFDGAGQLTLVIVGSVVVASYWTLQPLWIAPLMRRVIGSDDFGYGHTSSLLCLLTGYVARPFR